MDCGRAAVRGPSGRIRAKVGGHLYGRFWTGLCRLRGSVVTSLAGFAGAGCAPAARRPDGDARRLQISGRRLPANAGLLLDSPQRPAQPAQRDDLLFLFFVQDIAHIDGGYSSRLDQCPDSLLSLAGFQVTTIGRFWVTTEVSRRQPGEGVPGREISSRETPTTGQVVIAQFGLTSHSEAGSLKQSPNSTGSCRASFFRRLRDNRCARSNAESIAGQH